MTPREAVAVVATLWRTFGARGALTRGAFEARKRAGVLRADPSPALQYTAPALCAPGWPFAATADLVRGAADVRTAIARADLVAAGQHQAYRARWVPRPMDAGGWNVNPGTGYRYDRVTPWFRIAHFDSAAGDIKDAWEPARFAWAYDLARGFLLTSDERYAESFWRGFESFSEGCSPFRGVQWSCGQEAAIRAAAWLWAECAFAGALATSVSRVAALHTALAQTAERIEDAIGYGVSQRNNHGISEATGLVAIGARLRDASPRAPSWLARGAALLDALIPDQFARDGWYAQHSFNYARLALDQLVIAQRALRFAGTTLSDESLERVRAGVSMLGAVTDGDSGRVPLHGANDGAYVLPLSTREQHDFVPALTAAAVTFDVSLPDAIRPDGETLAWLGAPAPPRAHVRPSLVSGSSGWVLAECDGARLFARAGSYTSRPGHIDPLHVDIWIHGRPIATDAGTFRYAARSPWNNGLAGVEVHNTATLAGNPPAVRGPRFLWLKWPNARTIGAAAGSDSLTRVVLENRSWVRLGITHRRTCELFPGGITVLDEVFGPPLTSERIVLQWLVDGVAEDLRIEASGEVRVSSTRGDETSTRGWISEAYGERRSALSVRAEGLLTGGIFRVVTGFGEGRTDRAMYRALGHAESATASCST
ncbi:MAG: heparinase II/III family protein [Gemmatimonadaceae bacterium]